MNKNQRLLGEDKYLYIQEKTKAYRTRRGNFIEHIFKHMNFITRGRS